MIAGESKQESRKTRNFSICRAGASPASLYRGQPERLPYKFFFAQAATRSSAFSMFSIEFATLNRK
jgi:hypothetical protein